MRINAEKTRHMPALWSPLISGAKRPGPATICPTFFGKNQTGLFCPSRDAGKKQKAPSQRKLKRGKDFHQEALVGVEPTMADLQSAALATWLRRPVRKGIQNRNAISGSRGLSESY